MTATSYVSVDLEAGSDVFLVWKGLEVGGGGEPRTNDQRESAASSIGRPLPAPAPPPTCITSEVGEGGEERIARATPVAGRFWESGLTGEIKRRKINS